MHYKGHKSAFGYLAGNEEEHRRAAYAVVDRIKEAYNQMLMAGTVEDRKEAAMNVLIRYGMFKANEEYATKYDPERVSLSHRIYGEYIVPAKKMLNPASKRKR